MDYSGFSAICSSVPTDYIRRLTIKRATARSNSQLAVKDQRQEKQYAPHTLHHRIHDRSIYSSLDQALPQARANKMVISSQSG